jgi:hypothetical protein
MRIGSGVSSTVLLVIQSGANTIFRSVELDN